MTILSKNNQSGRSMVEMLGVLAIIGVLSVGGISGYSKAMAKYKLTKAQDQITMLLMNIRTAYATSPSYEGLNSQTAADYNLAPSDMIVSSGTSKSLYGTFGGQVFVAACDSSPAAPYTTEPTCTTCNYFSITMTQLGKEACRSLATSDWGSDGLEKILVTTGVSGTSSSHINMASSGLCDQENNSITWVYY